MYNSSQNPPPRWVLTVGRYSYLFCRGITLVIPVICIILALIHWTEMTPCIQRQVALICFWMIYWRFASPVDYVGRIWETVQFTVVFWIAETNNRADAQIIPDCLNTKGIFILGFIKTIFYIFLYTYTVASAIFILLILGILTYVLFSHFVLAPRRRRQQGLSQAQFDSLEEIEFRAIEHMDDDGERVCSICLIDFNNGEKLIQLPICKHLFHGECVKRWLQENSLCPYCRSDIKNSLEILKQDRGRSQDRYRSRRRSVELSNSIASPMFDPENANRSRNAQSAL